MYLKLQKTSSVINVKLTVLLLFIVCCYGCSDRNQVGKAITDTKKGDFTGFATSINGEGDIIALGAPFFDTDSLGAGQVKLFKNIDEKWTPLGEPINGIALGGHFGSAIAMNSEGTIIAISAPQDNSKGERAGKVQVFRYAKERWQQLGQDFFGNKAYDEFGKALSISDDGTILAIGNPPNPKFESDYGSISVYRLTENEQWRPIGSAVVGETIIPKDLSLFSLFKNESCK
mgnify:FL=1